jgi:hypothetical protein
MKKRLLAIALATLSITGITTPVAFASFPKMETCPIPDASKSSSYKTGFTANCPKGLVGEAESLVDGRDIQTVLDMVICIGSNAPADTNTNEWRQGCYDGYQAGGETYAKNLTSWPATTPDHWGICKKLQGYKALAPNTSYQDYYADGCILGYHNAVNNQPMTVGGWNDATNETFCAAEALGQGNKNTGCLAGFSKAADDYEAAFPALAAPTADENTMAEQLSFCGFTGAPGNDSTRAGRRKGCAAGYLMGFQGRPNTCALFVAPGFDERSIKHRFYTDGYKEACPVGYSKGQAAKTQCQTASETADGLPCKDILSGGIVPQCDPSAPPSSPRGCGVNKLVELINNIMRYLWFIALPIGALAIGWGGFQIMTAAGNTEKVSSGVGAIKTVVVGIAIMLASYFIVQAIFLALGVSSSFKPGGL